MRIPQFFVAAFLTSVALYAQDATPPAHISFVTGSAVVYHAAERVPTDPSGGRPDAEPAVINLPIVQGDRVQTLASARVEVMFPDGAAIAIESDSDVEFVTAMRVRVIAGAIEHLPAQPLDPRSPSTQNLPSDLQPYGSQFDQNGAWQYEPQYGNVWYPTTVTADWRPYYDGYWSSYPAYGWTWIGYEPWAWPTHHYGRWGYARSRWFWIPGRSYAAAWVSWGTAPEYVSWCPLGYDGRPVVSLSVGFHSSWNAWTVIPRDRFGARGYPARRYAVEPYRIASSVPFIEHRAPPARARRVGVNSAADGGAGRQGAGRSQSGGMAVPRGQATSDLRVPSSDRRRVDSVPTAQPATTLDRRDPNRANYDGRRIVTADDARVPRAVPRTPAGDPRVNPAEHPAYQPRYQPQFEPTYGGRRRDPIDRDHRANGEGRGRAPIVAPSTQPRRESRDSSPPPQPSPAPAPPPASSRVSGPPARGGGRPPAAAPAREPHGAAGREGRASDGASGGTAVRRPR